jgi:cysteine synthase
MDQQTRTNLAREIIKRQDILDFLNSDLPMEGIFDLQNSLTHDRVNLYKGYYFGIGKTECYKVNLPNNNNLYIKMEYANSMGNTHYSRFWLVYLFLCEITGIIELKNSKIIEVTSGSSGIALAMACDILGYNVTILVPELLPESRILPMRKENVEIIKVPGYIMECVDKLKEIVKADNSFFPTNHSEEKANIITHVFKRIASEIVLSGINLDYSILALGNGTTTYAIGKKLKERYPKIRIQGYKPDFQIKPNDFVFGLTIPNLDFKHMKPALSYIDEVKYTTNVDLRLLREMFSFDTEIHNFGYTSLYGVYFALELSKIVKDKNILTIGYDKIDRY